MKLYRKGAIGKPLADCIDAQQVEGKVMPYNEEVVVQRIAGDQEDARHGKQYLTNPDFGAQEKIA